jgi:signal transduction histidine kinase/CheY-like chemotaxis protein
MFAMDRREIRGFILAILIPFVALGLQLLLWDFISPFVWFLFFPAVFISARFGRLRGGLISTVISTLFVVYFFISPRFSWAVVNPYNLFSVGMFLVMGYLFSDIQERFWAANLRTQKALEDIRVAHEKISQLYEKTRELDELKTQFFANVSHELRTPLTLILGPVQKALQSPLLDAELRHNLEVADRNARFLHRHVNDLLDVSKLDAGHMALNYSQIDLAQITRVTASQFNIVADERGVDYTVAAPELVTAQLDVEKYQRILLNLLSNAFKFTPDGGKVTLSLAVEADAVVIRVCDSGPGIPGDKRQVVFERFRQLEGNAARKHGGTGLGLSIVKEFVELHHGEIQVDDAPLGGAMFSVRLPLCAPAGITVNVAPVELGNVESRQLVDELIMERVVIQDTGLPSKPDAPLILVVEDNPDMNEFISSAVKKHYRVANASNGQEGLEKAIALIPDLMLVDVMMPIMSGDAMTRAIRQYDELKDVPIIILTAKADDQLRVQMLQENVQDYINKPFEVEELLARVDNLLTARRQSAEKLHSLGLQYEHLFENMMEGFAYCKMIFEDGQPKDWQYLAINSAFEKLTGLKDVVGRRVTEIFPNIIEADPKVFNIYARVSSTGVSEKYENYLEPLNMWFSVSVYCPERGYFVTVFDVITERKIAEERIRSAQIELQNLVVETEHSRQALLSVVEDQKNAEEQIRRLNAELEQRVKERTAQLEAANHELEAFSYSVSHDLRAPLRALDGFSEALLSDYQGKLDELGQQYLIHIQEASRRMAELIEDLLKLSRITRSGIDLSQVDLSLIARQAADDLRSQFPDRQMDFVIAPDLSVTADPNLLKIVLANLLGNAVKFTSKQEIAHIQVGVLEQSGTRVIFVRDNGAGFDMAYADKLFNPFQRLHSASEFSGTGIGLTIVQRIIARHGGRIWAEASVNQGATFYFTLGRNDG